MIFLNNAKLIKDISQNAQMGIIGIDEIIYKIVNPKLLKEITGIKKEYTKIYNDCQKYLESVGESSADVSNMARLSSELMTQMKLYKDNSDDIIVDMMIKGTEKSLDILSSKKVNYEKCDIYTLKIVSRMFSLLNRSLKRLKKFLNI